MTEESLIQRTIDVWRSSSYTRREDLLTRIGIQRSSARFMAVRSWHSLPEFVRPKLIDLEANLIAIMDMWNVIETNERLRILTALGFKEQEAHRLSQNEWGKLARELQTKIQEAILRNETRFEIGA